MEYFYLIRSRRKSIALIVEPDGRLTVRAPLRLPQEAIEAFVLGQASWIAARRAELRRRQERCGRPSGGRRFQPDEDFWYLGAQVPLRLVAGQKEGLVFSGATAGEPGEFLLRRSAQPQAAALFERWYKKQARAYLSTHLEGLAARHGFHFNAWRLSGARTRWGSCSSQGTVSLNWRLIMAPPAAIDYVILHELAHLKERNHSRRFWTLLEKLCPGYKAQRQWLKDNGECLAWP